MDLYGDVLSFLLLFSFFLLYDSDLFCLYDSDRNQFYLTVRVPSDNPWFSGLFNPASSNVRREAREIRVFLSPSIPSIKT